MASKTVASNEIEIDPRVCNGHPVIRGTRIPITVILDHLAAGSSVFEIRRLYSELTTDQVVAAITDCHELIDHTEFDFSTT